MEVFYEDLLTGHWMWIVNDDYMIYYQVGGSGYPGHLLGAGGPGAGLLHVQEVSGVYNVLSLLPGKY